MSSPLYLSLFSFCVIYSQNVNFHLVGDYIWLCSIFTLLKVEDWSNCIKVIMWLQKKSVKNFFYHKTVIGINSEKWYAR